MKLDKTNVTITYFRCLYVSSLYTYYDYDNKSKSSCKGYGYCLRTKVASRAFVTRKRFSACWGNSPIPIERCLRHRAAHPFRMLQRQFLPKKKARCSMSITPTLHRTFHHRLLCLFSSSCRTSCSCSCSFFCSSSFRISCTIFCATSQSCISDLVLRYSA